jgi:hypothetical protein
MKRAKPKQTKTPDTRRNPAAEPQDAILLTPATLAARLAVPESWIREKTRKRARERDGDPLPTVVLGKYVRFDWEQIRVWLARQSH